MLTSLTVCAACVKHLNLFRFKLIRKKFAPQRIMCPALFCILERTHLEVALS